LYYFGFLCRLREGFSGEVKCRLLGLRMEGWSKIELFEVK